MLNRDDLSFFSHFAIKVAYSSVIRGLVVSPGETEGASKVGLGVEPSNVPQNPFALTPSVKRSQKIAQLGSFSTTGLNNMIK